MAKYSDYVGFRSSSGDSRSIQTSGIDRLTITQSGEWDINGSGYGTSGQVLTSQGTGKTPAWLPIAGANYQTFSGSSTWTKPAGCQFVLVEAWGAGGGGAGGGLDLSGVWTSGIQGGYGGGGGGYKYEFFDASTLPSSVVITIGAGGSGGSGATSYAGIGSSGLDGGDTSFGSYLIAFGGNGATNSGGGAGGASISRTFASPTAGLPRDSGSFGGGDGQSGALIPPGTGAANCGFCGAGGGGPSGYTRGGSSLFGGGGGNAGAGLNSGLSTKRTADDLSTGYLGFGGSNGISQNIWPGNPNISLRGVSFGNGRFVANAPGIDAISVSTNSGLNWNFLPISYPSGFVGPFVNAFYDGSAWIGYSSITGSGIQIARSTDLTGWTRVNITGNTSSSFITYTILYATGQYVAIGHQNSTGAIYTSTDLSGWTLRSSGVFTTANSRLFGLTHDGTRWMVVGQSGVNARSTDGITWTTGGLVTLSGTSNRPALLSVAGSGATYIAQLSLTPGAPAGSQHGIAKTTNTGNTWTTITGVFTVTDSSEISGDYSPYSDRGGIVFANSLYSLISRSGFYYSSDATTFTSGGLVSGLAGAGGIATSGGFSYVAVFYRAGSGGGAVSGIHPYRSTNGTSWTSGSITGITGYYASGTPGESGGIGCGGGGGAAAMSGFGVSGGASGGRGGDGYVRVYSW